MGPTAPHRCSERRPGPLPHRVAADDPVCSTAGARSSATFWLASAEPLPTLVACWRSTCSRGLTTSLIPHGAVSFEIQFDFRDHGSTSSVSDGRGRRLPLRPQSVAQFFEEVTTALTDLGIEVAIRPLPCEIAGAIPSIEIPRTMPTMRSGRSDSGYALLQVDRVFKLFRTRFLGKASPVHFFWGSFDLAVTRFSGRPAPRVRRSARTADISDARGVFARGQQRRLLARHRGSHSGPAFYAYMYPYRVAYGDASIRPAPGSYDPNLGEVPRRPTTNWPGTDDPDAAVIAFLEATYEVGAALAGWDRPGFGWWATLDSNQ